MPIVLIMNGNNKKSCATCPVQAECIFFLLNKEQRLELEANKKYLERKKDTILYQEGFPASEFIMLIEGIVKKTTVVKGVGNAILNFNKSGDLIGLNAAGSNAVYANSMAAFSDVKFCMFPGYLVKRFMKENPAVFNYVIARFSEYTEAIRRRMISMMYGNAQRRTAETLLMLREINKADINRLAIDREDMASLAGITRETLARVLSKFKTNKIISFDKKSIIIEQPEKLRTFASYY
jgi:CRP/FNR family transcriptional regulator